VRRTRDDKRSRKQANSLGQAAGGPALGSALVLSPTIALSRRLIVRDRETAESGLTLAD